MVRGKRIIIGGLVVCLAIGYLGYALLGSSLTYYSTVSELKGGGDSVYGRGVRVNGDVVPGSIEFDARNLILTFVITDERESLPVVYEGIVPDTFNNQTQVVLEGKLDSTGLFHASFILTKCPSKYEAEGSERQA